MGDGTLRSTAELLERSTAGNIVFTLDSRPSPDNLESDLIIQLVDRDDVIFNLKGDAAREKEILDWLKAKVAAYFKAYFQTTRGVGFLVFNQDRCTQPDQILDDKYFEIRLVGQNPTYIAPRKFWFWIGPVALVPDP